MAHETRIDIGSNQFLDIILRSHEDGLHIRHRLGEKLFEVLVDLNKDCIVKIDLGFRVHRDEVAVDVEKSSGNLVQSKVILIYLDNVSKILARTLMLTFSRKSKFSPHSLERANFRNWCAVVGLCKTICKTS